MYTWKTRYFVTAVIGIRLITWAQPSINIYMGVLNVRPDLDYCSLPAFALDRLNSVLQTIYLDRKALSMYTKYFETVWEKRNYVKQSKSRRISLNQTHSHTSQCYYASISWLVLASSADFPLTANWHQKDQSYWQCQLGQCIASNSGRHFRPPLGWPSISHHSADSHALVLKHSTYSNMALSCTYNKHRLRY